jgi:hypothetical protein
MAIFAKFRRHYIEKEKIAAPEKANDFRQSGDSFTWTGSKAIILQK